jgi:uncharacterized protein
MKITVHIVPNASRDEITGRTDDGGYRIKVQSPPVEGAANKSLVRFLAKTFDISKSRVRIVTGETAHRKVIEIEGDNSAMQRILEGLGK